MNYILIRVGCKIKKVLLSFLRRQESILDYILLFNLFYLEKPPTAGGDVPSIGGQTFGFAYFFRPDSS